MTKIHYIHYTSKENALTAQNAKYDPMKKHWIPVKMHFVNNETKGYKTHCNCQKMHFVNYENKGYKSHCNDRKMHFVNYENKGYKSMQWSKNAFR